MKKLFRKKGFTLVEVLVATVITMVLLGSVMAVFASTRNVLSGMKKDPFADRIENSVCEYIRRSTEKANGYRISGTNQTDLAAKTATLFGQLTCGTGEKNHCLIISNAEGNYRLYDLGVVTSTGDIASKITNLSDYNVFNAPYYDGMSCKVTFDHSINGDSCISYMSIAAQIYDADGNVADKPAENYFKVLNMPTATNAKIDSTDLSDFTTAYPDSDSCIVMVYRVRDYTA
ncbi:MAG: PilW family protein [Ruminiclostridium sp.]